MTKPEMISKFSGAASVAVLAFALQGCGSDDERDSTRSAVIANYAEIVHASYEDSLELALELDDAIATLVAEPSEISLDTARERWVEAREPYLQTEVYRFYDGPIDNPDDGPEGLINAWPLDENYIDYVEGDPSAGIINDTTIEIDAAALESLNEQGSEKNIATGYHAIEFLLWGQDLNDAGPGERPHTDYVVGEGGTAENQDRRGQYLTTVSEHLVGNLERLVAAWEPGEDNYRAEFESAPSDDALARMLTGMIILSGFETGGERLQAALETGDQEDEHSCFSDNTHRDMIQDIQGVSNVWHGTYTRLDRSRVSGESLSDLVRKEDAALAAALDEQIAESLRLANELEIPFDQEIRTDNLEGQARVTALIDSLGVQEELLQDVFALFDLEVPADP